jgi:hypothetical protein
MNATHIPSKKDCTVIHYGLEKCFVDFNGQKSHIPTTDLYFVGSIPLPVPELDIDKTLGKPGPRGAIERRIVFALIAHLRDGGFKPTSLWDGERLTVVHDAKGAMELIFNLDESSLRFAATEITRFHRSGQNRYDNNEHGVLIVLGNGVDCISDWNYFADDHDGFNKAMSAFNAEKWV